MADNDSDIYVTDREELHEGPSSSPAVRADNRKRPATARIRANRAGPPRAKRAKRTTAAGPTAASASASAPPPPNWTQVKRIDGECAPFNDKSAYVDDPINHRTFLIGGIRPDETKNNPSSDFYCCDTVSMRWENLTNSLTFRTPTNPFAETEIYPSKKTLPLLSYPGSALVRVTGKSFIFLFGGYDPGKEEPTSSVIIVDPDILTWWYLDIKGEGVRPRINPTAASVGNDVFIFGGHECFEGDGDPIESYNILNYTPGTGTWQWKVRDRPYGHRDKPDGSYENPVPANYAIGAAIPVYGGLKILLLPGRNTEDDKITFTPSNIFYYHINHDTFQFATKGFAGDFPKDMSWYYAHQYSKPSTTLPPRLNGSASTSLSTLHRSSIASPNGHRVRGRPRKDQAARQRTQPPISNSVSALSSTLNGAPNSQNLYSSPISPSIIICGWIEFEDGLAPELWHLFLSPEERVVCLNTAKHVWDLDHDFQLFFCAEGQLRIVGWDDKEKENQERGADHRSTPQDIARFDIYANLPY